MSESSSDASNTPEPASTDGKARKDKSSKPRLKGWPKWRRRLKWTAIILLVLGVLFRVLLSILLPVVINKAANYSGMDCTYDRVSLGVLSGEASIWGLKLTSIEGGDPIGQLEYVRGDISIFQLLRGRLVVWRAEADGVDLLARRKQDGSSTLMKLILSQTQQKVAAAPSPPSDGTSTPIDLEPPITIEAFRLSHVRAHIIDEKVSPKVDTTLAMDLRVSDIGRDGFPARFELDMWADPVLDQLRVSGTADIQTTSMTAKIDVMARGIRLKPVEGYLSHLGILPVANEISAHMSGELTAKATSPAASALDVRLSLKNMALLADGQEAAAVDSLEVSINPFDYSNATFAGATLDGVRARAMRTADGRLRVGGVEFMSEADSAGAGKNSAAQVDESSPASGNRWISAGQLLSQMSRATMPRPSPLANSTAPSPLDALGVRLPPMVADATARMHPSVDRVHLHRVDLSRVPGQPLALVTVPLAAGGANLSDAALSSQMAPLAFAMGAQADSTQPISSNKPATQPASLPLGSIALTHVLLQFDDQAMSPAVTLQLIMDRLQLVAGGKSASAEAPVDHALAATTLPATYPAAKRPAGSRELAYTVDGDMAIPGIMRQATLTGDFFDDGQGLSASLDVQGQGIRPDRLEPYLHQLGLESILEDASLTCKVNIAIPSDPDKGMDLEMENLVLADHQQWFKMNSIALKGLQIKPEAIGLDSLEIVGPEVRGKVLTDQRFELLGFRTLLVGMTRAPSGSQISSTTTSSASSPSATASSIASTATPAPHPEAMSSAAATQPATTTASQPATESIASTGSADGASTKPVTTYPAVRLGHFSWSGVKLQLEDESASTPTDLQLNNMELTLDNLLWDPSGKQTATQGKIHAHLSAPSIANLLSLDGTFTPTPQGLTLELNLSGNGLTAKELSPYLAPHGVRTELINGQVSGTIAASLGVDNGLLTASVTMDKLLYKDGPRELAAIDQVSVDKLSLDAARHMHVGQVLINRPRLALGRNPSGDLLAMGFVFSPSATNPAAIGSTSPSPARAASSANASSESSTPTATSPSAATLPADNVPSGPSLRLDGLKIQDAAISWNDLSVTPSLSTALRASITLENLVMGAEAPPAILNIRFSADGILEPGDLKGQVSLAPSGQTVALDLATGSIDGRALSCYLQPKAEVVIEDGILKAHLDAKISPATEGGQALQVKVTGVDFQDRANHSQMLKLDDFTVGATRIDPSAGILAFDTISLTGLGTEIVQSDKGLTLLGVRILSADASATPTVAAKPTVGSPPTVATKPTVAANPGATQPPAAKPSTQSATPAGATAGGSSKPANTPSAANSPAEIDEVLLQQAMTRAKKPLPLFTLKTLWMEKGTIHYRDTRKGSEMDLTLGDLGLMNDKWVEVGGPRAAGRMPLEITFWGDLSPIVKKWVVMTQVSPLAMQPAGRVDMWVSGISGNGLIKAMPFLADKIDGSTLVAGEAEAHVSAQAKTLRHAGLPDFASPFDADFLARQLAYRDAPNGPVLAGVGEIRAEGVHIIPATGSVHAKTLEISSILGRVQRDAKGIHVLGLTIPMGAGSSSEPSTAAAPASGNSQSGATASKPTSDKSARASAPSGPLPPEMGIDKLTISGIDFRLEDTSVQPAFILPINQLDVEVRGLSNHAMYKENMPVIFSAFMGADKATPTSEREVFSQISTNGQLMFYPQPSGWAKTSIDAFDLASLGGEAKQAGVTLNGGYLDINADSRFHPSGDLDNKVKVVITDLDYSEPDNGPVRRKLGLAFPTNTVIAALEDASGGITIPLNVPVPKGKLNTGAVAGSAIGAIGMVTATAVASAPFKVVGFAGSLLGIKGQEANLAPLAIIFPDGSSAVDATGQAAIQLAIKRMKDDGRVQVIIDQKIGAGDLSLAWQRANPSPEQVRQIAEQLRLQKFQLLNRRTDLQGQIRAQLAFGSEGTADRLAELHQLDRELSATESALDRTYELMRPGADRQALRRARAAALEIAQQRLDLVTQQLISSNVPDAKERVKVTNLRFEPPADRTSPGEVTIRFIARGK